MNESRLHALLSGDDRSLSSQAARLGLRLAEPAYRLAVHARNKSFDLGLRTPARLGRPTVSVGNLTTGGTGKTPMVIELVRRLTARGRRPAVLLRGYGDDEVIELRQSLRAVAAVGDDAAAAAADVPVEPDGDRAAAARRVLGREPGIDCFVLDDAFQRRQVHRDIDLVLIDATQPFGYGHLLPRGLLREPLASLRRAHGVIITRADQVDPEALGELDDRITRLAGRPALAHAAHAWTSLLSADDSPAPLEALRPLKVLGACGIGNPASFAYRLAEHAGSLALTADGPTVVARSGPMAGVVVRRDHHAYRHEELVNVLREAERRGADAVVTTEKDWVKWRPLLSGMAVPLPIYRPVLAMRLLDGGEAVDKLLDGLGRAG
ncbi:MAG: tetraacyldisaccharide 4'-kinase [Phycisphaeraceae bacterium]